MVQPGNEPNERLKQFQDWARQAHDETVAELRQRQLMPMNEGPYIANYVPLFEGYFRQYGRREA